jgi:hypothetical protein
MCAQQAAPANYPAFCSFIGRAGKQISGAQGERSRWVIPGSRLLSHFLVRLAILRK